MTMLTWTRRVLGLIPGCACTVALSAHDPAPREADVVLRDFRFHRSAKPSDAAQGYPEPGNRLVPIASADSIAKNSGLPEATFEHRTAMSRSADRPPVFLFLLHFAGLLTLTLGLAAASSTSESTHAHPQPGTDSMAGTEDHAPARPTPRPVERCALEHGLRPAATGASP